MRKPFFLLTCTFMSLLVFTASQSTTPTYWEQTQFGTVINLDGISMTVQSGVPPKFTVLFTNKSAMQCSYEDQYWLEKKIDGKWYQVPVVFENYDFISLAYILPSEGQSVWAVDLHRLYGNVKTGEYRIVKRATVDRDSGGYEDAYFTMELSIS